MREIQRQRKKKSAIANGDRNENGERRQDVKNYRGRKGPVLEMGKSRRAGRKADVLASVKWQKKKGIRKTD